MIGEKGLGCGSFRFMGAWLAPRASKAGRSLWVCLYTEGLGLV